MPAGRLEHIVRADDVGGEDPVEIRLVGNAAEMDDPAGPFDQAIDGRGIGEIGDRQLLAGERRRRVAISDDRSGP